MRQSFGEKSVNGSEELQALKTRYHTLCQRLKTVQKALKERHAALLGTTQARVSVRFFLFLVLLCRSSSRFKLYFFVLFCFGPFRWVPPRCVGP